MRPSTSWPLAALLAATLPTASALYFYMEPNTPKCFTEELVHETLVVGHYSIEIYNRGTSTYEAAQQPVEVQITMDEIFDDNHRVHNTKSGPAGKFTFTAADSGDHKMCFTVLNAPNLSGWLMGASGNSGGTLKFNLDMVIGDTSDVTEGNQSEMEELVSKVRDLNNRLEGIRREQIHQREREAEFRDVSEAANARVVRYALVQLAILGVVGAWQFSHLRSFFIKQKLT